MKEPPLVSRPWRHEIKRWTDVPAKDRVVAFAAARRARAFLRGYAADRQALEAMRAALLEVGNDSNSGLATSDVVDETVTLVEAGVLVIIDAWDPLRVPEAPVPAPASAPVAAPADATPAAPAAPSRVNPPARQGTYSLQNVRCPPRFAPSKEKIRIEYEVIDDTGLVTSGWWQLIRKLDAKVLATNQLTADQLRHGAQFFEWDGAGASGDEFPDGYVTVQESPYQIKVVITGNQGDRDGKTETAVELADFIVELAPVDRLTEDDDRTVHGQIGSLPASSLKEIRLESNLFAVDSGEMYDSTGYSAYETRWSAGPRIPILATVRILDSKGNKVRDGKALGHARVLWDYADPAQTRTTYLSTTGAAAFVNRAKSYDTSAGRPQNGDDCHVDRGGKRAAAAGGDAVLAAADGSVTPFPFTIAPGATRWWGAFCDVAKDGDEDSRAGVVFRPARMAGDNYAVKAYLDLKGKLDTAAAVPAGADRTADVGTFEVWREINLATLVRKSPAVTSSVPTVTDYYADAYIRVKNDMGAGHTMTKDEYDAAFTSALAAVPANAAGPLVVQYSLPPDRSQYDLRAPAGSIGGTILRAIGDALGAIASVFGYDNSHPTSWVATVRAYQDFKRTVKDDQGYTDSQLATVLANAGVATEVDYATATIDYVMAIATEICKANATQRGVTIQQFEWVHSLEQILPGRLNGNAVFKAPNTCGFALYNPRQDTTGHEIGHDMFLPHAPRPGVSAQTIANEGIAPHRHDGADMNCLMSYNRPRPGFCGLCVVRLRGWKESQFNASGPTTVK